MCVRNVRKSLKKKSGFSLMEIFVAVVIMGIFAALALPRYNAFIEKNKAAEGSQILMSLLSAQLTEMRENGAYENNINNIAITIPPSNNFDVPQLNNVSVATDGVAIVQRSTDPYNLRVFEDGSIECWDNAALCQKMGFATP